MKNFQKQEKKKEDIKMIMILSMMEINAVIEGIEALPKLVKPNF